MQILCFMHLFVMRKRNLFTILFLVSVFLLQAQVNNATIYGFRQRVTGGAQKGGTVNEDGTITKVERSNVFQYTIYLATASTVRVYPVQMWINGEVFSVETERGIQTPILQVNTNKLDTSQKVLVPNRTGQVLKLVPAPLTVDKSSGRAKSLASTHAVVVLYKSGGKLRYGVLKKFTDLNTLALP